MVTVLLAHVVDGHHVGMHQGCGGASLGQEQIDSLGLVTNQRRVKHLDGTGALQHVMVGAKDPRHPAATQKLFDVIVGQLAANQPLRQLTGRIVSRLINSGPAAQGHRHIQIGRRLLRSDC